MRAPVEYYKEVLSKISFADRATFRKKAFRLLGTEEREELKRWFRSMCLCRTPQPVLERVKSSLRNLS